MSERITIWLQDHGPVRIDPDKWPVVKSSEWTSALTTYSMEIREHKDGRLIVYGKSTVFQSPPVGYGRMAERRRGDNGLWEEAVAVGKEIGLSESAVQDFIAPLLAQDLD